MAEKITKSTSLKKIKQYAWNDFGILLTNDHAKEIRESMTTGCAIWTAQRYMTTRNDSVRWIGETGVRYSAYNTRFSRAEWNKAVKAREV